VPTTGLFATCFKTPLTMAQNAQQEIYVNGNRLTDLLANEAHVSGVIEAIGMLLVSIVEKPVISHRPPTKH